MPSTPPEKPFLSTLCLDVFCRQTSNSLWENKIAPCHCYPKGLASQIHSSDRGKDLGERRMQRILQSFQSNSLKRFGWDYLVLGPTSSVAAPLIPRGALLLVPSAGTGQLRHLLTPGTILGAPVLCPDVWVHIEILLKISAFNYLSSSVIISWTFSNKWH